MKTFIDIGPKQITLKDARFYYEKGVFQPSVSTVLDCWPKDYGYYKWLKENGEDSDRIMEIAGNRGSNVHQMSEIIDKGLQVSLLNSEGVQQWKLDEWAMICKYVEFRKLYPMEILAIEMQIICHELGAAGTLDRLVKFENGKRYLLDIKTSNGIYESMWLQVAAYRKMFEITSGQKIDGVGIIWLNSKTRGASKEKSKIQGNGWQLLLKEDTTEDYAMFEKCLEIWKYKNRDILPKEISYSLNLSLNATP
jgi:hypothetical protein